MPDRAIAEVAAATPAGPWVAHVSGATPLAALDPHGRRAGEPRAELVGEHGAEFPDRVEEWSFYLASLHDFAAPGGDLPPSFDALVDEVFGGIRGLKGVHCCGNTDWSILLKTKMDILNFDAYAYAQSVALYPDEIKKLIG